MEEFRERFPEEVVWNILKYTRHPCAELVEEVFLRGCYDTCDFCRRPIFMSGMRWRCKRCCLICEGCYEIRGEDFDRQDEPVVEGYDEPEAESYYSDNDSVSDSDSGDD